MISLSDHHVIARIENILRQLSSYIIGVTLVSHSLAKFLFVTKIISDFVLISDLVSITPENSKILIILKFQASNSDQPQENIFYIKWFHWSWLGLHWRYQSRPRIWFQCLTIDGNIENIITKCLILFGISSSCPEFRIYNIWFRCRFYFYRRYNNFETFLHGSYLPIRLSSQFQNDASYWLCNREMWQDCNELSFRGFVLTTIQFISTMIFLSFFLLTWPE